MSIFHLLNDRKIYINKNGKRKISNKIKFMVLYYYNLFYVKNKKNIHSFYSSSIKIIFRIQIFLKNEQKRII